MKKCPYCAENIQDEALVCRFCGRELEPQRLPGRRRPCPFCAEWIRSEAVLCRYCGRRVETTARSKPEPPKRRRSSKKPKSQGPGPQSRAVPVTQEAKEAKIRLLIVDDYEEARNNIRELVKSDPEIEVIGEAGDGFQAIELYDEHLPDVVSMDINMPEMDGITATRLICGRHPDARVFMLTIQDDESCRRMAASAGAMDYLLIPPSQSEYISTVKRLAKGVIP